MSSPIGGSSGRFGLISGTIGLTLCLAQSLKGHVDAKNERERLQEMHEQKMHFLHEFHRQELRAKDHKFDAADAERKMMEAERRAVEAERVAGMFDSRVPRFRDGSGRVGEGNAGTGDGDK